MRADLHNHTIHSDGVLDEVGLLKRAKENNIDVLALTDHDSIFGCEKIYELGKEYGIKVIKGMELSTDYKGESVHIICLFKNNIIPEGILQFSKDIVRKRKERAIKMMEGIKDIYGLKIDLDSLLNENEIITRANMLRNIAKCNNMSLDEASFYVSFDSKAYIPSTKMQVAEGLKLANDNDCFTILAHPCLIKNKDYLNEILEYPFNGIEAKYANKKNDYEYFKNIALEKGFIISAGSDCHGDSTHQDIGSVYLDDLELYPIAKALSLEGEIYGN